MAAKGDKRRVRGKVTARRGSPEPPPPAPRPRSSKVSIAARIPRADDPIGEIRRLAHDLRRFSLGLPGAYEAHPRGEPVTRVGRRVFVVHASELDLEEGLRFSVELPRSGARVLAHPFAAPAVQRSGRVGWITIQVMPSSAPPVSVMRAWIEESYRAVAPPKYLAQLEARAELRGRDR